MANQRATTDPQTLTGSILNDVLFAYQAPTAAQMQLVTPASGPNPYVQVNEGSTSWGTGGITSSGTVINAGAGNDHIIGGVGNDTIDGGTGTDIYSVYAYNIADPLVTVDIVITISANTVSGLGIGSDTFTGIETLRVAGWKGNDTINAGGFTGMNYSFFGGEGNDYLAGGSKADRLSGDDGDDFLTGGLGNDQLLGGAGTDSIHEVGDVNFVATDTSLTGVGTDILSSIEVISLTGGAGNNILNASALTSAVYADLDGGDGNDTITGGSADRDFLTGGLGNDVINGGAGLIDYLIESGDVNFLATDTSLTGLGTDTLSNIEVVYLTGGASANTIDASALSSGVIAQLAGLDGNDILTGGSGNDILGGDKGDDLLIGGLGYDTAGQNFTDEASDFSFTASGSSTDATLEDIGGTGYGTDTLQSIEHIYIIGGNGIDNYNASGLDATVTVNFFGAAGDDFLIGGDGDDILTGGAGDDLIDGGSGLDWDTYRAVADADFTANGDSSDTFVVGTGGARNRCRIIH